MEMESPQNSTDEGSQGTFERRPKKTKRFTSEQIIALESIFKVETKLEPRKKVQVARDLGLQPRQVAIWFQNRRARWKSKHTEQELRALRGNFDSLSMQFDGLKKENLALQMQLQELRDLVKNLDNSGSSYKEEDFKEYTNSQNELGIDDHHFVHTDEENIAKYLKKKEEEDLSNLAAPEEWCKVSYTGLFDQSSATSDWWQS